MIDSIKYILLVFLTLTIILFVAFMPHKKIEDLKEILKALGSIF